MCNACGLKWLLQVRHLILGKTPWQGKFEEEWTFSRNPFLTACLGFIK